MGLADRESKRKSIVGQMSGLDTQGEESTIGRETKKERKRKIVTKDGLMQMSYYFTEEQINKIDEMAYFEKKNKSEIVRDALTMYIKSYENKRGK